MVDNGWHWLTIMVDNDNGWPAFCCNNFANFNTSSCRPAGLTYQSCQFDLYWLKTNQLWNIYPLPESGPPWHPDERKNSCQTFRNHLFPLNMGYAALYTTHHKSGLWRRELNMAKPVGVISRSEISRISWNKIYRISRSNISRISRNKISKATPLCLLYCKIHLELTWDWHLAQHLMQLFLICPKYFFSVLHC